MFHREELATFSVEYGATPQGTQMGEALTSDYSRPHACKGNATETSVRESTPLALFPT